MTIFYQPTNPFNDIIDILVKDLTQKTSYFTSISNKDYKPSYPYNMCENEDKSVTIEIVAIGLDKSDIKIEIDGEDLRTYSTKDFKEKDYFFNKIVKRKFDLYFKVPKEYETKGITSKLDKGILSINIPLNKEAKNKKFSVNID